MKVENKSMLKKNFNNYYELSLYLLAIICFIYYFIHGNIQKTAQPILITSVVLGLRLITKITNIELHPILKTSLLTFIFMAMFMAVEFNLYKIFPPFDKVLHSLSGIIFFFVGLTIFKYINRKEENVHINTITVTFFCLLFAISVAGCWEIFEFTVDRAFGMNCQNGSLFDTMGDIICGTTGASITAICFYLKFKEHDIKYILNYFIQHNQVQAVENEALEKKLVNS